MNGLVDVQGGFLAEALRTDVTLEGLLTRVRPVMNVQVGLAGELGRTLLANVRFQLDWKERKQIRGSVSKIKKGQSEPDTQGSYQSISLFNLPECVLLWMFSVDFWVNFF